MACTSSCPNPGSHESWGACARAKRLQIAGAQAHAANRRVQNEQDEYRAAREAGLQPDGVSLAKVRRAQKLSDLTGEAYRADKDPSPEVREKLADAQLKLYKAAA